jgi:lambda repressor-like predicted transcriptional regulator
MVGEAAKRGNLPRTRQILIACSAVSIPMDEDTERLRDIFLDVTETDTVTESQTASPGTLAGGDADALARLSTVIEEMRQAISFETDLSTDTLARIVRAFYAGETDDAIASTLDIPIATVFAARMDLHLFRESDLPAGVDPETLDTHADATETALAERLDTDPETIRRARHVRAAREAARDVSDRFRDAFADVLTAAGLETSMTAGIREDGLWEATEDIDSLEDDADVDF